MEFPVSGVTAALADPAVQGGGAERVCQSGGPCANLPKLGLLSASLTNHTPTYDNDYIYLMQQNMVSC